MSLQAPSQPLSDKASRTTERGLARAQAILRTAYELFRRDGYAAFSVRSVAASAGISLSNVQHYFPSKDSLIEAMLGHAFAEYQNRIDAVIAALPDASRLEKFAAVVDLFIADMKRPDVAGTVTQIWTMALQHPPAAATVARMQERERKTIFTLIHGLNPAVSESEYQARAALIVAQIEGLAILFGGKARRRFTPAQLDEAARQSFIHIATSG